MIIGVIIPIAVDKIILQKSRFLSFLLMGRRIPGKSNKANDRKAL